MIAARIQAQLRHSAHLNFEAVAVPPFAVGAGSLVPSYQGLAEIAGIGTLEGFRRRGVAVLSQPMQRALLSSRAWTSSS